MKKGVVLILLFIVGFIGCKKDDTTPSVAVVPTGAIRYINNSNGNNRYELYLDGGYKGLLAAGYYWDCTSVPAGSHIVKARQFEGYLLVPTVVEKTINVSQGSTIEFSFP
jgi:hypothetical protein